MPNCENSRPKSDLRKNFHMLNNLSGIAALQEALATTNALLADVLAELKETNSKQLETIAAELRHAERERAVGFHVHWCARGELNPHALSGTRT